MQRAWRRVAIIAGALAMGVAAAAPAWADSTTAPDRATEKRWRAACLHDAFDVCTFLALSGNRAGVRNCLERNISRISPACRAIIQGGQGAAGRQPPPAPSTPN
jgi:hypothetical protein